MRMPTVSIFLALLLSTLVTGAPRAADEERMTIDDVLSTVTYRDMAFSPDGRWLVWSVSRSDEEANEKVGDLWRLDLSDEAAGARRLTHGPHDDHDPAWSPDGRWIAYLSERGEKEKAKTQVWRIAPDGGEAEVMTEWKPGVKSFRWGGDGRIYFTAEEGETERERQLEKKKDDVQVVEDLEHWKAVRLFAFDPEEKKVTRLTTNEDRIQGFWLSRNGTQAVTSHQVSIYQTSQVGGPRPRYRLHDLQGGDVREILGDELFDPQRVEFSADGEHLWAQWLYSRISSEELRSNAGIHTLWRMDLESGERERVVLDEAMGLADHVRGPSWTVVEGGVVAVVADGVHGRPVRVRARGDGWRVEELESEEAPNWKALTVSRDGERIAVVHTAADEPERLRVGRLDDHEVDDLRTVHDANEKLREKTTRAEPITWSSSLDGAEITGILTWPHDYQEGRRYPLMVWIHGGPTGVDADNFESYWGSYPHLLAERGMFVLQPNYRGSSNHGLDAVESITLGKYYEYEIPDIESGVDHLIDQGLVHPDSLGTKGWSNGAILSIQLTVESDRYQVCVAGAGDVNWTSDFGNCAFGPNFDVTYFGTTPWDDPELYVTKSPLFRLDEVTTPTLIQFGEKDRSVPTEQGWQHYRALQMLDRAPVRFLLYPGMGHGLTKLSYQRRKIEEDLAWIDRHLFGRSPESGVEPGEGSPLASLLRRGELELPAVVPAVAEEAIGDTEVLFARTEVTRAQFALFLDDEAGAGHARGVLAWSDGFPAGTGELPVSGVDYEAALAYAAWLSERTGEPWRLPTVAEWDAAAETASPEHGNNLCHWAGYTPTFDETAALRRRVEKELGPASLLLPVASIPGDEETSLFDLHGSVAEWCTGPRGGVLRGRCALDSCDPAAQPDAGAQKALPGLRVVREP